MHGTDGRTERRIGFFVGAYFANVFCLSVAWFVLEEEKTTLPGLMHLGLGSIMGSFVLTAILANAISITAAKAFSKVCACFRGLKLFAIGVVADMLIAVATFSALAVCEAIRQALHGNSSFLLMFAMIVSSLYVSVAVVMRALAWRAGSANLE